MTALVIPHPLEKRRLLPHLFGSPLAMVALTLTAAGLFAAGVLSLGHLLTLPVPCGGSRGCTAVAHHPSSKLFGIPLAYIGFASYIVIIFLITQLTSRWARIASVIFAGLGAVASGVLLYYSQTVIRATCPWCVASGIVMTLLLIMFTLIAWRGSVVHAPQSTSVFATALLLSVALGLQAGYMQMKANEPPIPAERLRDRTADELIDPQKTLGPKDAPVTILVFADMWCPSCRAVHQSMIDFQKANPTKVRLAYRHLPLHQIRGHEFSGTGAALSELAAESGKFWEYLDRVYEQRTRIPPMGYVQLLGKVGVDPVKAKQRYETPDEPAFERVLNDIDLAESLGITSTPTFIVLLEGQKPISANTRTLTRILNSPYVQSLLTNKPQTAAK